MPGSVTTSQSRPTPNHLTLLLKSHTLTLLLSTPPTASLTTLRTQLLSALRSVPAHTLPPDILPLPAGQEDIFLGLPFHEDDPRKGGWRKLGGGRGAGDTVRGVGVKDGGVIAFRWRGEGEEDVDEDGEEVMDLEEEEGGFVVEWPKEEEDENRLSQPRGTRGLGSEDESE